MVEPEPSARWEVTTTLRSLVRSDAVVTSDAVASGVVITSDSAGSYYKELLIAEFTPTDTTIIRVATSFYDIYGILPRGAVVAIRPKGLCFREHNGLPQLGYEPAIDGDPLGEIPTPLICASILHLQGERVDIKPRAVRIDEITAEMVGLPVVLRDVYFENSLGTLAGERWFAGVDTQKSITLYTSPYCSFSGDAVPSGLLQIEAVVEMYKDDVQLKLLSAEGVTLLQN